MLANNKYRSVAVLGDDLDESKESEILANWNITSRLPELLNHPYGEMEVRCYSWKVLNEC